ncbi:dehydrogenase/reductase SDR family member 4-like [Pleurodeles waltl]|uniref:dehydrogenase/reductase SDR family member 4-like n=1 Tax=Pleurodeles waltl TaxID=8319 RepID=UPI00370952AC
MLQSFNRSQEILRSVVRARACCHQRRHCCAANGNAMHAGKVAVMTASTKGIGLAIARRLGQQGAKIVLSSRKQENVNRAVEQLEAENLSVSGTVCDVGKMEDRSRLLKLALDKYGGIDYLFSNAAYDLAPKNVLDSTEEEWDTIFHLNVKSMFLLVKQVYPHMQKRGGGSIVLTSSVVGFSNISMIGPYSVSKTAVNGLTKVLAPALAPMNIRVNALAPGIIRTEYSKCLWFDENTLETLKPIHGISRAGEPEECAGMVSFLLSSDASYVTGEIFVVGGGFRTRI